MDKKYDKILTPNRLSEFIINVETGEFVTEWDVLKTKDTQTVMSKGSSYKKEKESFQKKVVDTESFNYAPADYVEAHRMLDVLPASPAKEKKLYLESHSEETVEKNMEKSREESLPGKIQETK